MADVVRISKTLSFWLRHKPEEARLSLDREGWAETDALLNALAAKGLPSDIDTLLLAVESNDKQRFELSPDLARIRARQGHSIEIDLALEPRDPPAVLFHGTVERFVASIMAEGLSRMRRHHVHLSAERETAERVGARRGGAVVLEVDAAGMRGDGVEFFVSGNGVWLTAHVPARFLRRL